MNQIDDEIMKIIDCKLSLNDYYEELDRQVKWKLLDGVCRQVRHTAMKGTIEIKYELNDRSKEEFGQKEERQLWQHYLDRS